ncbi:MAG: serine hydrolase [Xanthomonadales bacterium]|nr:serine hydrolase [Xanthomonadales bacterium]
MKLFPSAVALAMLLAAQVVTASETAVPYEEAFQRLHQRGQFNGAVLIEKDGKVVLDAHFGMADAAKQQPLSDNSLYRLASVSKTITAAGLLTLVDAGKVALDDPVQKYLPEFPHDKVTVRHLLQHSSGLPEYIFGLGDYWPANRGVMTNHDVLVWLSETRAPLAFEPGLGWDYCNTGYALIPLIIERVTRSSYSKFLRSAVFRKAGMRHTYHISELNKRLQRRVADGHGFDYASASDLRIEQHPVLSAEFQADHVYGAGDIYSTPRDLLAFDHALRAGKVLSAPLQKQAYTSMVLPEGFPAGYGLGWQVAETEYTGRIIHHHGQGDGYRTRFYRFIDKGITIITLQNAREQYADAALRVAQQLAFKSTYTLPPISLAESLSRTMHEDGAEAALARIDAAAADPAPWSLSPRDLNNLALTYWFKGDRRSAVALMKAYLELFPEDPTVFVNLAEALAEEGDAAGSRDAYRRALEIAQADPARHRSIMASIEKALGNGD